MVVLADYFKRKKFFLEIAATLLKRRSKLCQLYLKFSRFYS